MRNVIITGGSRGLGLAIATRVAAAGYRSIVIARHESEPLRAAMSGAASAWRFHAFDLNDTAAIGTLVEGLRREHGPIYGLINNAGAGTAGVLSMMRDDQIERLLRLNLIAPVILTKYVLRSMMIESSGRIINVSSVVAATGFNGLSAYAASKAGLVGFTRSLAREVGPLDITVNAIAPGFLDTDMTSELDDSQRERIVRRSALRRMPQVDDVAHMVEFLLSDKARNITGTTMTVDAGATA